MPSIHDVEISKEMLLRATDEVNVFLKENIPRDVDCAYESIRRHAQHVFHDVEVVMIGSHRQSTALLASDLDIALVFGEHRLERDVLHILVNYFRGAAAEFTVKSELLTASVPLIRLDHCSGVTVDVTVGTQQQKHGVTDDLIRHLLEKNPSTFPAVLFIKAWAVRRRVVGAYQGFPNSVSWVALFIAFCQLTGHLPPIDAMHSWEPYYCISTVELITLFFHFCKTRVLSNLAKDCYMTVSMLRGTCSFGCQSKTPLMLEDPGRPANNLASSTRVHMWRHALDECSRAYMLLMNGLTGKAVRGCPWNGDNPTPCTVPGCMNCNVLIPVLNHPLSPPPQLSPTPMPSVSPSATPSPTPSVLSQPFSTQEDPAVNSDDCLVRKDWGSETQPKDPNFSSLANLEPLTRHNSRQSARRQCTPEPSQSKVYIPPSRRSTVSSVVQEQHDEPGVVSSTLIIFGKDRPASATKSTRPGASKAGPRSQLGKGSEVDDSPRSSVNRSSSSRIRSWRSSVNPPTTPSTSSEGSRQALTIDCFKAGDMVEAVGLKNNQSINGLIGRVIRTRNNADTNKSEVCVSFEEERRYALSPENLRLLSPASSSCGLTQEQVDDQSEFSSSISVGGCQEQPLPPPPPHLPPYHTSYNPYYQPHPYFPQ